MTRLNIWKVDLHTSPANRKNAMLINASSIVLASFWTAKNDPDCDELDIKDLEFDYEEASCCIDLLRSKESWKSVRLSQCHGAQVNDLVMACMNLEVARFHLQILVNSQTIVSLSFGLRYSHTLKELSLSTHLSEDYATNLAKALARNTCLESLSLAGSEIEAAAIPPLSFALRLNRTLQRLNLDACRLEDDQVSDILIALQHHPSLKFLSLQQNSCHTQAMQAVAVLLHLDQLEDLDLSYLTRSKKKSESPPAPTNEAETKQDKAKTEYDDTVGAERDEQDKEVQQEDSETKSDNAAEKSDIVKDKGADNSKENENEEEKEEEQNVINTSLKVLQLAGNNLNDSYVASLLGIFGERSTLEELNLFGNRITDSGVQMILHKLPSLKRLNCLWLGQNPFGLGAATDLVQAVREANFSLEEVTIRTMDDDPKNEMQVQLDFYAMLNRGGRKVFAADPAIPLPLWPVVLERANQIYLRGNILTKNYSNAADCIFCLLHGPVLFDNPELRKTMNQTGTSSNGNQTAGKE
jgi:hypothetical protein